MRLNIKFFIILLLFFVLISLTCVNAVDNQTDNNSIDSTVLSNEEDNILVENNNDEILNEKHDGTFTELQNMINNAQDGSTVTLEHDYFYNDGFDEDGIKITKDNIIIDGKNHTIHANTTQIFTLAGKNITLKNINFIYGLTATSNSTIYNNSAIACKNSNFTILNCSSSVVSAQNTEFTNNNEKIYFNIRFIKIPSDVVSLRIKCPEYILLPKVTIVNGTLISSLLFSIDNFYRYVF